MNSKTILVTAISMCFLAVGCQTKTQRTYEIDLRVPDKEVETGFLKMGGTSPDGGKIDFNSYYISVDGRPTIPILGEIHFSRIPRDEWEEAILKMKAGGVNVICTYIFWNIHEQYEGRFNWSGDYDVRHFTKLCRKHDMKVIMRIGPFCHGEIRNGGIPDWLYGRPFQIRTNDAEYLKYVDRLYGEIGRQLKGLYYQDGGNIIAVQLENELQHSAAPWSFAYVGQKAEYTVADYDIDNTKVGVSVQDQEIKSADLGERHMQTLRDIANSNGISAPFYTATGWGSAAVLPRESIPVTSAYPYPFWSTDVEPSPLYLFKDIQAHPDYEPVRYESERYPSFCVEMGAGIQMIYSRRPRVPAKAAEGLMIRSIGSGANGIGYYMYTGGITPQGRWGFFSDEPMGVPKMSYDYQAPIGEFGKTRDSYNTLRLIHNFVSDFGDRLAPMGVVLPEGYDQIVPEDDSTLRYAVRKEGNSGFVFITNFQDHVRRKAIDGIDLTLLLNDETIDFTDLHIAPEASIILPFNFNLGSVVLKKATAQPLAVIRNGDTDHYFFFVPEGMHAEYTFDASTLADGTMSVITPEAGWNKTIELLNAQGQSVRLTTLTREEALRAVKLKTTKGESLILTNADVLQFDDHIRFQQTDNRFEIIGYPSVFDADFDAEATVTERTQYAVKVEVECEPVEVEPIVTKGNYRRWQVNVPEKAFKGVSDLIFSVDYVGDTCVAFIDGEMIDDHFYSGDAWRIGLKRFKKRMEKDGIYFYFRPIGADASYLIDLPEDKPIDFSQGDVLMVNGFKIIPEYAIECKLN